MSELTSMIFRLTTVNIQLALTFCKQCQCSSAFRLFCCPAMSPIFKLDRHDSIQMWRLRQREESGDACVDRPVIAIRRPGGKHLCITNTPAGHPTARCSSSKYAIHVTKHHPFFKCHHPPSHWSFSPDFNRLFVHRRAQQRQMTLMRPSFKCPMWSVTHCPRYLEVKRFRATSTSSFGIAASSHRNSARHMEKFVSTEKRVYLFKCNARNDQTIATERTCLTSQIFGLDDFTKHRAGMRRLHLRHCGNTWQHSQGSIFTPRTPQFEQLRAITEIIEQKW